MCDGVDVGESICAKKAQIGTIFLFQLPVIFFGSFFEGERSTSIPQSITTRHKIGASTYRQFSPNLPPRNHPIHSSKILQTLCLPAPTPLLPPLPLQNPYQTSSP